MMSVPLRGLPRVLLSPRFFLNAPCTLPNSLARAITGPLSSRHSSNFVKLDATRKIEEEELPYYVMENYFPVNIGDMLASKYKVLSKLGFGTSSTSWLCRSLDDDCFYTIKVGVRDQQQPDREIAISQHLKHANDHFGKRLVRLVLDSFQMAGPHGNHTCLVYQPLGMSFTEFQNLCPNSVLPKEMIQRSIQLVLISLAFLHENNVVHTDISTNNILQGIDDVAILSQIEQDESQRPVARKVLHDRQIYFSRLVPLSKGLPVLSDFGDARIGKAKQKGDIMPGIYRAPEVILGMEWDHQVDIWSIGVMAWDMAEGGHLFFAKKDRVLNDEQHLAEMVSLLGPPPAEFIRRSVNAHRYWDSEGNWKGSIPVPAQSLEMRVHGYSGEDKELFLRFLRRTLCWVPEERPTAEELAYDDFLMQAILAQRCT